MTIRGKLIALCVGLLLLGATTGRTAQDAPPRLVCPRLPEDVAPPVIDGRLDDPAWAAAAQVALRDAATGELPKRQTTARLTWDDENLYIAFNAVDDSKANARLTVRDANLWEEEVVEMFLDPDGDLTTYAELEVNPLNTLFDAYILNNGKRTWVLRDWDMSGIQHAVARGDTGWTVEVLLPFEEFAEAAHVPPQIGDVWRANLYRIERSDDPKTPELTSWSRTFSRNFHNSRAFGLLEFSGAR